MTVGAQEFFSLVMHPLKFRMFLLTKLPSAYFSGVRVVAINADSCQVMVRYSWFSKNPFRSTYFACMAMAAEMSTGVLSMGYTYKRQPAISMLVTSLEAKFIKKATGKTIFTCDAGREIAATIEKAVATGEGQMITVTSIGKNISGELIAEFNLTWSFKSRKT